MYASIVRTITQQVSTALGGQPIQPEQCMLVALHAMQLVEKFHVLGGADKKVVVMEVLNSVLTEVTPDSAARDVLQRLMGAAIDALVQVDRGDLRIQNPVEAVKAKGGCLAWLCGSRGANPPARRSSLELAAAVPAPAPVSEGVVAAPVPAPEVGEAAPAPEVGEAAPAPEVVEAAPAPEVVEAAPAPEVVEAAPVQPDAVTLVEAPVPAPGADAAVRPEAVRVVIGRMGSVKLY